MRHALAVALLAAPAAVVAQQAAEGPFVVNFTTIGIEPEATMPIGPDQEFGLYSGMMTASNAAGEPLLHNMTGRCLGWFVVYRDDATYEQHGHCRYADAEGDEVFERFDFDRQPLAPVRVGAGRWLGGTGKFDGLQGTFEIRVRPLTPAREGVVQGIGSKEGNYRIPAGG